MAMKDAEPVVAKAEAERRRFRRVRIDLPGRLFIPSDSREARCTIAAATDEAEAFEILLKKRVELGSDGAQAVFLGVSRSYVARLLAGDRPLTEPLRARLRS